MVAPGYAGSGVKVTADIIYDFRNQEEEAASVTATEPVNILVVDDLPEKLLAYEAILEELGQNVISVRTGEEALKLVLRMDFAVILLDVNMPGMDGFETAMLIRQRKKSAHIPIIFLTAFTDEIRMAQGYATGAVDYLPTPVVPEILQAKVRVFIELSRMRRQAALQAEEYAMRKAAEESARRLEFLVNASEVFAHAQQDKVNIMQSLIRLPVSYLADTSGIFLLDNKTGQLKLEGLNLQGNITTDPLQAAEILSFLEKEIRQVLATGQSRLVTKFPEPVLLPEKKHHHHPDSCMTAIMVPFIVRDRKNAVFVLISHDASRDLAACLSLSNDLVSRASIALENAILMEKIKEDDRRKDEFLAMLAHELRNPLAPISNALNILKLSSDETVRNDAEHTIGRQIDHMVHLVDDLMDISRITQGKIDLRRQPVVLQEAIGHAIETSDTLIKARGHRLKVDLPQEPIWLDADFGRLSQIFSNLLNNAAKYTNDNGLIEIYGRETEGSAVISVRDNGIGIPAHMLQRVFDIFSQVDSSLERSQGGLGIGLTLVRNLVEMHGGNIEAFSAGPNTGSEFKVALPVIAAQEQTVPSPVPQEEQKPDKNLKVLIVDDNEALAKTTGWMIEFWGHSIYIANDGASAIRLAHEHRPEVVLLDIGLPGMNGYDICKIMKNDPLLKNTIFIAQTGWGQMEHRRRSREAGFDYHLVKPVPIDDLQHIINKFSHKSGDLAQA